MHVAMKSSWLADLGRSVQRVGCYGIRCSQVKYYDCALHRFGKLRVNDSGCAVHSGS